MARQNHQSSRRGQSKASSRSLRQTATRQHVQRLWQWRQESSLAQAHPRQAGQGEPPPGGHTSMRAGGKAAAWEFSEQESLMSGMQPLKGAATCAWEAGIFLQLACHPRKAAAPWRTRTWWKGLRPWVAHVSHGGELREAGKLPDQVIITKRIKQAQHPCCWENKVTRAAQTERKKVRLTRHIDLVNIGLFRGVGVGTSRKGFSSWSGGPTVNACSATGIWLRNRACIHRTVCQWRWEQERPYAQLHHSQVAACRGKKAKTGIPDSECVARIPHAAHRGPRSGAHWAARVQGRQEVSIATASSPSKPRHDRTHSPRLCSVEEEVVFW